MKTVLISILVIYLSSCETLRINKLPCGNPEQVQRWHDKKKFRAEINTDSLRHVKFLAMARKY